MNCTTSVSQFEFKHSSIIGASKSIEILHYACIYLESNVMYYIYYCMFIWSLSAHSREFFTPLETSPLPVKGCKCWLMFGTYDHWAERVFLACHTYFDTGHPFIMFISEDPWHSHLLLSVWQWSCHYLF